MKTKRSGLLNKPNHQGTKKSKAIVANGAVTEVDAPKDETQKQNCDDGYCTLTWKPAVSSR